MQKINIMITFTIALVILLLGYFIYGKYIDRVFGSDEKRVTPVVAHPDGVDFVQLPSWKIFMIQFLNIAGLGPIFGAIMGARYGTSSYIWIVFGTIFAGAVHDYMSGMISLRNKGASLPQIVGMYLGTTVEKLMIVFITVLMILVGAVFVSQPADLLAMLTPKSLDVYFWIIVIFIYYLIATMFPVDKIIGKFYPIFAFALLFMAIGIMIELFVERPDLPEMWEGFGTKYDHNHIFPMMFVSIACGAISGFHATQSPMMARCLRTEKHGRPIFYGAMVAEGIVALVWAAMATAYYQKNGADQSAGQIVMNISQDSHGRIGAILAMIGVIVAPITSGDTALRAGRLIIADLMKMEQKTILNRLKICIPMFAATLGILIFSITNKDGFAIIWRYFSWCNQTLSVFTLWAITVYLSKERKNFFVSLVPAMFMTCVTTTYICVAKEGLQLPYVCSCIIGGVVTLAVVALFAVKRKKWMKNSLV